MKLWGRLTKEHLLLKLLSVFIAIILWGVVIGSRNVELTKEVALEVVTSGNVIVGNDLPEKIQFKLSGPKAFLRAIEDRKEEPIRVNLSAAKPGMMTYRFYSDNIRTPIGVRVTGISPASIPIRLEAVKKKEVPVKLEFRGSLSEGMRLIKTEVIPSVVSIKGAESKVDAVKELSSVPIDLTQLKGNTTRPLNVELSRVGVQLDQDLPKVNFEIETSMNVFKLKNITLKVEADLKYKVDEKPLVVFVKAHSEITNLNKQKIIARLNLKGMAKGRHLVVPEIVLPEGVQWVRTVPDSLSVQIGE